MIALRQSGKNFGQGDTMPIKGDNLLNKLIMLFVFDKMEVPLSLSTLEDICSQSNDWINYMDCHSTLSQLIENNFVYDVTSSGMTLYSITPNGRVCLADFFVRIPASIRESISAFVKNNRNKYRRKQEYVADYYMNKDGTYTVYLKILEPVGPQLELKLAVPGRQIAKSIFNKWEDKAENVYRAIYDNIVD